ncbi:DUF2280 domain-containing protein [Croceibacterium mercuriale]|uniref:DUF2280 domain-containing protein n=1 Tax=Croceibacterium mercuriale TaxID=1572751 RepID=UPI00137919C1|nr:DUF2280 domain-containing protein [Croceibacterium mercuriale]
MAHLTEYQKLKIVQALASFQPPTDIIEQFRSDYGIELTHKQVGRYDPTRSYYEGGDKWRQVFQACRVKCFENVSAIPVAHKAYRLNVLQEGVDAAKQARNWPLVIQLLKQAAKEVGTVLTNNESVRADDTAKRRDHDTTPEERRATINDLMRQAVEGLQDKAAAGTEHGQYETRQQLP